MMWVILPIIAGFFDSIFYTVIKKLSDLDTYSEIALLNIAALPFIALGFLFFDIPKVSAMLYAVALTNIVLFFLAQILMIKSLKISNLSVSIPMLSFTPVFLFLTSYLMLSEFPTLIGLFGILFVVLGSYLLNIGEMKEGYFEPFKSLFRNRGVFYMIIVAFLYSLCANLGKIGVSMSNPVHYTFVFYFLYSLLLLVVFFNKIKANFAPLRKNISLFILGGFATAVSEIVIGVAYLLSIVPYIISLKRTSILFSVFIGAFLLREKGFKAAIIGSTIMLVGVLLISLS